MSDKVAYVDINRDKRFRGVLDQLCEAIADNRVDDIFRLEREATFAMTAAIDEARVQVAIFAKARAQESFVHGSRKKK